MIWDADYQYVALFSHFSDILHGKASVCYSLSDSLGGNMYTIGAYYFLFSPINLIAFFFDRNNMYICFLLIMLIKTGFSGMSMFIYLRERIGHGRDGISYIMSLGYAANAYIVAYFYNFMWLDGIALLPIVMLGLDKLIAGDKKGRIIYVPALAICIIINFYVSFMICLFAAIYFIISFLIGKKKFGIVVDFTLSSFTAGLISCFATIPSMISILSRNESISNSIQSTWYNAEVLRNLMWGSISPTQLNDGSPLIYAGIFTFIAVIFAFISRNCKLPYKIKYGSILLILFLSTKINALDLVWGIGHEPSGCHYRYMFLAIFIMLTVAADGISNNYDEDKKLLSKQSMISSGILVVSYIILFFIYNGNISRDLLVKNIAFTVVTAVVMLIVVNKKIYLLALILLMADLGSNAYSCYKNSETIVGKNVSTYNANIKSLDGVISNDNIDDNYRLEYGTAVQEMQMDTPLLVGTYGITGYSSLESKAKYEIIEALGYETTDNGDYLVYNEDNTKAAEALLGIRYIVTGRDNPAGNIIGESDRIKLYDNGVGLPLSYIADQSLTDINTANYGNYFEWMNDIYAAISPESDAIFEQVDIKSCDIIDGNADINDGIYTALTDHTQIMIQALGNSELSGITYIRYGFDRKWPVQINAYINGEEVSLEDQKTVTRKLGNTDLQTDLMIIVTIDSGEEFDMSQLGIYTENIDSLKTIASLMATESVDLDIKSDSHITIDVNVDSEDKVVVISIPNEQGWSVYVDGNKTTEAVDVIKHLTAIKVPSGQHVIEMKYVPPGLRIGAILSLCGIALFVVLRKYNV